MATIYGRLINHFIFKYQTVFSARFDKQDEDGQMLHETEIFLILGINQKLTKSNIDIINVRFRLEQQIQSHEMKDICWRFD